MNLPKPRLRNSWPERYWPDGPPDEGKSITFTALAETILRPLLYLALIVLVPAAILAAINRLVVVCGVCGWIASMIAIVLLMTAPPPPLPPKIRWRL